MAGFAAIHHCQHHDMPRTASSVQHCSLEANTLLLLLMLLLL
jgi:hypothetical protein